MATMNTDNSINREYIPEEILLQILLLLPVKSLLCFKSVCKSWLSLITSSDFVERHHRLRPRDRILMYGGGDDQYPDSPPPPPLKFALLSDHDNICSDLELTLPGFSPETWFDNFTMLYFDGIICLYYHDVKYTKDPANDCHLIHAVHIYIWNPATRRIRQLPQPAYPLRRISKYDPPVDVSVGFGFNDKTNSYEVVRLTVQDFFGHFVDRRVELYNLKTGSWKTVRVELDLEAIIDSIRKPLRNGRIYCWSGRKIRTSFDEGSHMLVWFDFSNHKVRYVPFPDCIRYHPHPTLTVIRDNVASILDVGQGSYVVCVMNEFGNKESWDHLYKVDPFWERTVSISNDSGLFLIVWNKRLCILDTINGGIMSTPLTRDLYGGFILEDVKYKESLVSIEDGRDAANSLTTAGHKRKRLAL